MLILELLNANLKRPTRQLDDYRPKANIHEMRILSLLRGRRLGFVEGQ